MLAMHSANVQRDDEAFAWEARECLRKLCIGQVSVFLNNFQFGVIVFQFMAVFQGFAALTSRLESGMPCDYPS